MPTTRQGTRAGTSSEESEPLMARVTTERMQGTEEEQNAPVTSSSLDERIKAAREQRNRLLKEQELRQIKEHIQLLERVVTYLTPIIPTTSITELLE